MLYNNVKVVILAAGMSTRLRNAIPKSLIPLKDEETILDKQIANISHFIPIENIYLVLGFKKELFMERYHNFTYIYNNAYAFTNTAKSLLRALSKINSDVVWMNGDVVFDPDILGKLLKANTTATVVNTKQCGQEEIKYSLDKRGFIKNISKDVVVASGEALGINMFKKKDIPRFVYHLGWVGEKDYFEKAMENMIKKDGLKVKPIYVKDFYCKEIDFSEDLKEVLDHIVKLSR